MTNLSDEDLAAIKLVRDVMEAQGPEGDRAAWERVLALAGEEPPEPEDQTFWYDPQDRIVYHRDDLQNPGFGDNWYAAGRMSGESWRNMGAARRRLVQLVPKEEQPQIMPAAGQYQEVLMELLGAWEAEHREKCIGSGGVPLSKCQYRDCVGHWKRLHDLGARATWEREAS